MQNTSTYNQLRMRQGAAFDTGATAGIVVLFCAASAVGLSIFGATIGTIFLAVFVGFMAMPLLKILRLNIDEWAEDFRPVNIGKVIFVLTLFSPMICLATTLLISFLRQQALVDEISSSAKRHWQSSQGKACTP